MFDRNGQPTTEDERRHPLHCGEVSLIHQEDFMHVSVLGRSVVIPCTAGRSL